jgi:signal transduction histidine kinase
MVMKHLGVEPAGALPALLDALGYLNLGVVVVADRGGNIERIYANEVSARMLGYTLEEINLVPPIETVVPEQRAMIGQLSSSFRSGTPVSAAIEMTAVAKDGSHVAMEIAMGHFALPDGIAYVSVLSTRSGSSQLSLLEADRIGLVGALAAGFAHEINNPLTSVLLNLRSLRKQLCANLADHAQPQALRCLDDVAAGAERIASNVRALQTLATRSGTKRIDLAAVVTASLRLAAPTLEPRAHVIRQIFPVRAVDGEESRIGQAVLAMLLFSASGFDAETANTSNRIIAAVEERGNDVVVEVSDNGRDLTAEEARHAFDPFFRSPARGAGVGVGLGVARSVAATLGGEVVLAPRTGGGAVITMRLPAATD